MEDRNGQNRQNEKEEQHEAVRESEQNGPEAAAGTAPAPKTMQERVTEMPAEQPAGTVPARDFEAEWRELAEAHPEIVGKTLPEEIFKEIMTTGQTPLRVYEASMLRQQQEELDRLRKENEQLRQNRANAERAPVKGTAEGGGTGQKDEDPFLAAFNRYR